MTLENVLTMTTGLDWTEGDAAYGELYRSRDWVKSVLDQPMRSRPGAEFQLLLRVFARTVGNHPAADRH